MTIKLNLNIFLFLLLFFIINQIKIYSLMMIFAFIHELSHLIFGLALGFKPDILRIMPLGFSIEFKTEVKDYNKKIINSNMLAVKEILISVAGPAINILIVIVGLICNIQNEIIYANLLIAMFNLLPIYPLDGGRIFKNMAKIIFGNRKANSYINIVSNTCFIMITMIASILILIYKNIAIFIIILFLLGLIIKENKRYNTYNKIYKVIDKSCDYL